MSDSPIILRVKGIDNKLEKDELYAALYNIAKHRGVSYLEDLEEAKESDSVFKNIKHERYEYPCQIQMERYEKYGAYRGTIVRGDETFINTFTIGMYEKEARAILETQSKYYNEINESFIERYIQILKSKREYYIGPGNMLSRTKF